MVPVKSGFASLFLILWGLCPAVMAAPEKPLNVILITVDDMNWDSVGVYGCKVKGTTPNIDSLAAQGLRFQNAHVAIAVCQPCRNTLNSGRYPSRNVQGFYQMPENKYPTLPHILKKQGYRVGVVGKEGHSAPYENFRWDMALDKQDLGSGRDPMLYKKYVKRFIKKAQKAQKPFYLMFNTHDPHRPFHREGSKKRRYPRPSKLYQAKDIVVPGFLPDIPAVRKEIAEYYSSVRRADDAVGELLSLVRDLKLTENTVVVFLSDHGMALPFAKTNCYLHSTKSPWIVRWPGVTKAGAIDAKHFISTIDFMPTILAGLGLAVPKDIDGRSFMPLLKGKEQVGRTAVFTEFHETVAGRRYPMRAVQNARYGYIFNAWADGQRVFRNESQNGRTFKAMRRHARSDKGALKRLQLFNKRVIEEFYDYKKDPDARNNLIHSKEHQSIINKLRGQLAEQLTKNKDPAAVALMNRNDPEALKKFMNEQERLAKAIRERKKQRKRLKK
jgi:N-sulfoglucosamine sulfohydrolase